MAHVGECVCVFVGAGAPECWWYTWTQGYYVCLGVVCCGSPFFGEGNIQVEHYHYLISFFSSICHIKELEKIFLKEWLSTKIQSLNKTSSYIFSFAKQVMSSPVSVCWLIGLSAGFHKKYWTAFHETWMEVGSWTRICRCRFFLSLTLRDSEIFLKKHFCSFPWEFMYSDEKKGVLWLLVSVSDYNFMPP